MERRGVSPVIATVLLLVLTIVAVSILAVFVVPFVKNSLKGSNECFDVLGDIRFDDDSAYNCYASNDLGDVQRTGFSVRIDSDRIAGFTVTLYQQGSATPHTLQNSSSSESLRMLNGNFNEVLTVPLGGGIRTYVALGKYERAELNPILRNGEICKAEETINLVRCTDQSIIDAILSF